MWILAVAGGFAVVVACWQVLFNFVVELPVGRKMEGFKL